MVFRGIVFIDGSANYKEGGVDALINSKPCPENPNIRVPKTVEDLVLYVRREFGLGQQRISWYLQRSYGIRISSSGVFGVLKRNNMGRLPTWRAETLSHLQTLREGSAGASGPD